MVSAKGERNTCVKWNKILSIGTAPCSDYSGNFSHKDLVFRENYEISRNVKVLREDLVGLVKNDFVEVICKIHVSTLKKPLFKCRITTLNKSFLANTSTTVANKLLSYLGHKKKWSGPEFFGFRRQDVRLAVSESAADVNNYENNDVVMKDATKEIDIPNIQRDVQLAWVGVVSLGNQVVNDPNYDYVLSETKISIQPGFLSVRDVTKNGVTYRVYNEIVIQK